MTRRSLPWLLILVAACKTEPGTTFTTPADCALYTEPIAVSGTIDVDTAWLCNTVPYLVEADVDVGGGATLTVGPGVTVQLSGETSIVVGNDSAGGSIVADGSLAPITFTSTEAVPSPGDWEGLVIDENALTATFDHVVVEYGGNYSQDGSAPGEAGIVVLGTADITNSTFRENNRFGIQFGDEGSAGAFGDNTFSGNTEAGLEITSTHLASIASANTFGATEVVDVTGGTVETSGTWAAIGAPYHMEGDTFVESASGTAEITVEPGATFRFDGERSIVVGEGGAGAFVAAGTAKAPIVFTSSEAVPEAGDWEGIVIDGNAVTATFDHTVFSYGGNYTQDGSAATEAALAVIAGAEATITNSTFLDNNLRGILFAGDGAAVAFHDNTFSGNTTEALEVEANALGSLQGPNTFGAGEVVGITGDTVDTNATWDDLGAPYHVKGDVYVAGTSSSAVVTIAAGTELQMDGERSLIVGETGPGGLVADASGGAPIVFTSAEAVPGPGDWEGVAIDGNATVATFRNVQFHYGGNYTQDASAAGEAALFVIDNDVTVTDCTFTNANASGFTLYGDSTALAFSGNTFADNPDRPMSVPASAVASLDAPNTFDAGDRVEVRGATVGTGGTWSDLGAPYHVISDVFIEGSESPVITIAPGVTLELDGETSIVVGRNDGAGLVADGSTSAITFTSAEAVPDAGDWEGLMLDGNTVAGSYLNAVTFEYCGNYNQDGTSAYEACVGAKTSNLSITGCSFADSEGDGIDVIDASPTISGNSFVRIAGSNIDY